MKEISLTEIRMAEAVLHAEMLNARNVVSQNMFEQSPKIQMYIILMTWTKVFDSENNATKLFFVFYVKYIHSPL
jgi:hypothetical protein